MFLAMLPISVVFFQMVLRETLRIGRGGYEREAACAAGIRLGRDGDDLVLEAAALPPAAVIDLLSRHRGLASWRAAAGPRHLSVPKVR
jgi:hypothetical protein